MKLHLYADKVTEKELKEAREIGKIVFQGKKYNIVFHNFSGDIIYQETLTEKMLNETEKNNEKN